MSSSTVACPVCGVAGTLAERVPPAEYFGCPVCDTLFQYPMPTIDQVRAYLDRQYAQGVYTEYAAASALKADTFGRRVAKIRQVAGGRRLLDVGASCGFMVEAALAGGYDAVGVELSSEAISKASPAIRDRLIQGDLNELRGRSDERFDVVTAFDVIEHIFDPVAFLASVASVLAPGGWLVVTTPDVGHFTRRLLRAKWPMFQPMQHTVLFSERGLRLALSKTGYERISIEPAYKTLTADYLAGQVQMYVPALVSMYEQVSRAVPESLRTRPINVNIGEIMAVAQRPVALRAG